MYPRLGPLPFPTSYGLLVALGLVVALLLLRRLAQREGLPVSVEVTPHHLAFTEDDLGSLDTSFKMMPPLRTAADGAALRTALQDGVIDIVATDHAPHTPEEKSGPFDETPNGVIGVEWAAAVVHGQPLTQASRRYSAGIVALHIGYRI